MPTRRTILTAAAMLLAGRAVAGPDLRLMMVRRRGCVYCAAWDREIGPVYADHAEGRAAPLLMVDVKGPYPDGLALARTPWLTPSFILLQAGVEVTRIEGYPGADRFFGVLRDMIGQLRATG